MFISWMLITPSFKKSLIVEQFQGNYLKWNYLWRHHYPHLHNTKIVNIYKTKNDIPKTENAIRLDFENPFK